MPGSKTLGHSQYRTEYCCWSTRIESTSTSLGSVCIRTVGRRTHQKVQIKPGIRLRLCTAEDLIVYKAFANRPLDWIDIEGIIARQTKSKLDWKYVFTQLTPLAGLKEEPEILPKLRALIDEF